VAGVREALILGEIGDDSPRTPNRKRNRPVRSLSPSKPLTGPALPWRSRRRGAGHHRVGIGNGGGARDHFNKGNRPTWGYSLFYCRMFLNRMEKDPDWPKWIQPKKDQPKP
jgi:hypothetical protein